MSEDTVRPPSISFPITSEILRLLGDTSIPHVAIMKSIHGIIRNLPTPRVYVCEPPEHIEAPFLWEEAYDHTISLLIERGEHVVDARILSILIDIHREAIQKEMAAKKRTAPDLEYAALMSLSEQLQPKRTTNLLLEQLIKSGDIDIVYISGCVGDAEVDRIDGWIKKSKYAVGKGAYWFYSLARS